MELLENVFLPVKRDVPEEKTPSLLPSFHPSWDAGMSVMTGEEASEHASVRREMIWGREDHSLPA